MKELTLRNCQIALVDDDIYEAVSPFTWSVNEDGYVCRWHREPSPVRGIRGKLKCIKLHSVVLPPKSGFFVDHRNHQLLDNRRSELRYSTHQTNGRNRVKQLKPASSIYKGVTFSKKTRRWQATIGVEPGKHKWLGYFDTEQCAALAYNAAAIQLHGEFAHLNAV
jgi:hypothetical protein